VTWFFSGLTTGEWGNFSWMIKQKSQNSLSGDGEFPAILCGGARTGGGVDLRAGSLAGGSAAAVKCGLSEVLIATDGASRESHRVGSPAMP
jgi:hypothetical protein